MMSQLPNPYVGPYAFREEDARLFFGRDREADSLAALVIAESVVLFFAQSGTGKTSLIQAKLVPELVRTGFDVLPLARVGTNRPASVTPTNIYVLSVLRSLAGPEVDPIRLQSLTLGAYLWTLPARDDKKPRRVLICDQFEEILTPRPQHREQQEGFFRQLRQALEDEPSLSVLLVMREDNLAELEPWAQLLPSKLRHRFRMESLGRDDALTAARRPAELSGRPFAPEVAERLVDDLRRVRREGEDPYLGDRVEPLHLQVVCYELWESLRTRPGETITAEDLVSWGNVDQALERFYERAVRQASERSGIPPERIRRWCTRSLITPTRKRAQVSQGPEATDGLPNKAVEALVATRLIRELPVRSGIWYELVHDRFIEPVQRVDEAESTPLTRDAQTWDRKGRDSSFLYAGQKLEAALKATWGDPEALSDLDRAFLDESQATEVRQAYERKQAHLRTLAATLVALVIVMTVLAVYAFVANRQATSRELAARARSADPDSGLRLAVQAVETAKTLEAEAALHAMLNASLVRKLWRFPMKSANAVAFSRDGSRLAAVGDGGEADLLDVMDGRLISRLNGHTAAVNSVAFSPDGRWLATGDSEGKILLRKATGEVTLPPLVLGAGEENVNGLAFSPDSTILAVASDSPVPTLWSAETGRKIKELQNGHGSEVWDVAFSSDGSLLATAGQDHLSIIWDLLSLRTRSLAGHSAPVMGVAFQPGKPGQSSTLLASSGQDTTVRLWDLRSGAAPALFGHTGWVSGVAFSRDGVYLATASFDGSAKIWDVSSREELFTLLPGGGEVAKVAFSPQQGLLATASHSPRDERSGAVTAWWVLLHDEAPTLSLSGRVLATAFTREGKLLVAYGEAGRGVLWDPVSRAREARSWCGDAARLLATSFSEEGEFVTCTAENGVVVRRTADPSSAVVRLPYAGTTAIAACYSPLAGFLPTLKPGGNLEVWEHRRGSWQMVDSFLGAVPLQALALSEDGKRLAVGRGDGVVVVQDVATRRVLQTLSCHREAVLAVAFSPDGHRLATGSADRTAKVWDLAQGMEIATFPGHLAAVSSVAFNREGTVLATADASGTIRLEKLALEELVARARWRLAKSLSSQNRSR